MTKTIEPPNISTYSLSLRLKLRWLTIRDRTNKLTMLTKTVDLNQVNLSVKELLYLVAENTEVVLTKGEIPVARVLPVTTENIIPQPGLHLGAISISDDFDDPLTEEFWTGNK